MVSRVAKVKKKLGILAFGSLLSNPGKEISRHIVERIPYTTPFRLEYVMCSTLQGDPPTLGRWQGGKRVQTFILLLDIDATEKGLAMAKEILRKQVGGSISVKWDERSRDFRTLIYHSLRPKGIALPPSPRKLARLAVRSVVVCKEMGVPQRNGIRYLLNNIENGIITPLTEEYKKEILLVTRTETLEEAKRKLLRE